MPLESKSNNLYTFSRFTKSFPVVFADKCFPEPYLFTPTMISAVTPAVISKASKASHSSAPNPLIVCLILWVYNLAKNLNARTNAATDTRMIDTASKAGPRLAFDGLTGRLPQLVPVVPAPNDVAIDFAAVKAEVDPEDAEMLDDKAGVVEGEGVLLAGIIIMDVIREGDEDDDGLADVEGAAVEAAEAEDRTAGQKVLPKDWTSGMCTWISITFAGIDMGRLTLKIRERAC